MIKTKIICITLNSLKKQTQINNILKLTPKMTNTVIKKKLLPHVENDIRIENGYKGLYVARNINDTELIIDTFKDWDKKDEQQAFI